MRLAAFGRLPARHGVMATSPQLLEGDQAPRRLATQTAFTREVRTVVGMAIIVDHACRHCVPARGGIAKREKVDDTIIDALRDETPRPDARPEALRPFAPAVAETSGGPAPSGSRPSARPRTS